jgi:hypothetical protein
MDELKKRIQATSEYGTVMEKAAALQMFKQKNFTKEQLEHMISLTLVEGGIMLSDIREIANDWERILKVNPPPLEKKAPYMDLDD